MRKRNVRNGVRLRGNESGRIINYCIEELKMRLRSVRNIK